MLHISIDETNIERHPVSYCHAEDYARNCSDAMSINLAINAILDIYENTDSEFEQEAIDSHAEVLYETCLSIEAGTATTDALNLGLDQDVTFGYIAPETKEAVDAFIRYLTREWDDKIRTNIALRFLERLAGISR